MKYILYLFVMVLCLSAQDKGKKVVEEASGKDMLIGCFDREAFQDTSFAWWYNSGYENYDVDSTQLDALVNKLDGLIIEIVMGTWCSDSRREVPRFYKILDYLKFTPAGVKLIAVDRDKKGLNNELESVDIKLVPTFIFYRDGQEIGRIVESPEESLEKDLARILAD